MIYTHQGEDTVHTVRIALQAAEDGSEDVATDYIRGNFRPDMAGIKYEREQDGRWLLRAFWLSGWKVLKSGKLSAVRSGARWTDYFGKGHLRGDGKYLPVWASQIIDDYRPRDGS